MSGDPFSRPTPRVFSVDAGRPFLDDLAAALVRPDDPLALADALIFVPTRRAALALADAFARAHGGAALLPRIEALGDIEEDELVLHSQESFEIPPAASPLERRLVLARMVAAAERQFDGQERWPAALAAADELAALLDSFYTEEITFDRVEALVPEECAEHWAISLRFLKIVVREWPLYLEKQGLLDPAQRRVALIDRQAKLLARLNPAAPVIVAGTTGSAPAVARLMRVVAKLPRGGVVLPGLDRALAADAAGWDAVDDPHPQAGVKAALSAIGAAPRDVALWPNSGSGTQRLGAISLALRPAGATDDWLRLIEAARTDDPGFEAALSGLQIIEAEDEEAEAAAIALLFRETVEAVGRSAMLATPDRGLGRRVAAKMSRWGIVVADSAGAPLSATPAGAFLRLVAEWLAAPGDAARLLALARHPLCRFGLALPERTRAIDALDRALRGPAPAGRFDDWARRLERDPRTADGAPALQALGRALRPWPEPPRAEFSALLDAHLGAAEALSAAADGSTTAWAREDGAALATLLAEVRRLAPALGAVEGAHYADAFTKLLADAAIRRGAGAHPRFRILGPLEARLQSADLVILGGLNEGTWPAEAAVDPFLPRQLREAAGLPSPERRIGLAAHDFAQLAAAPRVALTRSKRSGGAPTRPSRWIVRLKNIIDGAGAAAPDAAAKLDAWRQALDRPEAYAPARRPEPRPPVAVRPRSLWVTEFETLMRDPYSVYGREILNLRALDPVGAPLDARALGNLLHAVFEEFSQGGDGDARTRLGRVLAEHAPRRGLGPAQLALWGPRLQDALDWFSAFDAARRRAGDPAVIEAAGEMTVEAPAGPFTLKARPDRIDRLRSGGAAIFDYKSGSLPTFKQMRANFSPQLPLTALIVEAGGFAALGAQAVDGFAYVKCLNRSSAAKPDVEVAGPEAREAMVEAARGMRAMIEAFDDPTTAYHSQPRPQFLKKYPQFDRLARRREWIVDEEEETE
jgi:ATP-dependent helicase/nuclease subunit B